jgi:hypothetical protein
MRARAVQSAAPFSAAKKLPDFEPDFQYKIGGIPGRMRVPI